MDNNEKHPNRAARTKDRGPVITQKGGIGRALVEINL